MDIRLSSERLGGEWLRLFVDDRLMFEADSLGTVSTPADLEKRVQDAICAKNGMAILASVISRVDDLDSVEDHVNKPGKPRTEAAARGLIDGLRRKTVQHSFAGVPNITPEHSTSYRIGYEAADAIRRALDMMHADSPTPTP